MLASITCICFAGAMTLADFKLLDLCARTEYVWAVGDYVGTDAFKLSNFYVMWGFFVEVELNLGDTSIVRVIPFTRGNRYARMVECMTLSLPWEC